MVALRDDSELRECYVWIRPDPDVPREVRKTESGGQLSTVLTRTRAGETRARQEEIQDGRSRTGVSECSEGTSERDEERQVILVLKF